VVSVALITSVSREINVMPTVRQISRARTGLFRRSWSTHKVRLIDCLDSQRSELLGFFCL